MVYRIYEDYGYKIFVAEFETLREAKRFLKSEGYHPDAEVWIEEEEEAAN